MLYIYPLLTVDWYLAYNEFNKVKNSNRNRSFSVVLFRYHCRITEHDSLKSEFCIMKKKENVVGYARSINKFTIFFEDLSISLVSYFWRRISLRFSEVDLRHINKYRVTAVFCIFIYKLRGHVKLSLKFKNRVMINDFVWYNFQCKRKNRKVLRPINNDNKVSNANPIVHRLKHSSVI